MDYDDFPYEDNEGSATTPYSVEDAGDKQGSDIYIDPKTGQRFEVLYPFREAEAENAAVEKKIREFRKREENLKKEMKRFTDLTREEKDAASTAGVVQRKKWRREAETGLSSGEGFWNDTWQVLSDLSGTYDSGEEPAITKNQNALVKIFEGKFKKTSQLHDLMNDSDKLGLRDSGVQFNKWMEAWAKTEDIKQHRRWLEANGYLTRDDDGKLVSGGRDDAPGYDQWKQMRSKGYITGYEGTDSVEDNGGYGTRQEYINAYAKEARRYAGEILRDRAIRKVHARALLDYSDKSDRRSSIDEALEAGYENIPYTLQFAKPLVAGTSSFFGRAGKLTRDNVELNLDSDGDIDVIKGDDVLPALGRAALGAGAEVATELYLGKLAGKLFNGMGALTKSGLQKIGIWDKGAKIAQKTGADKIGRAVSNLMLGVHQKLSKTLHYDGIIGEMAEEFVQQTIDNSWLGQSKAANEYYGNSLGKSVKEFFKTDKLRELLFGTTATMLLLGGVAAGRRKMIEHNLTPKMDATLKDNYGMTDGEIKDMSFRQKLSLLGFGYDEGKYAGKFQKRGWLEDETDNWGRTLDEALSDLGIKDSVVRGLTNEQKLKYLNYTMSVDDMSKEDRLKFAEALGDTMSNIVEKIHTANKLHDAFGENEASDWQSYKSKFNMPTATDESGKETPAWRTAEDGTRYVYDEGSGVGIKENSDGTYTVSHYPTGYTENVVKKGDHRNMATAALAKAHEISKRAEEAADLRSKKDKVVKGLEGSLTGNTRIVTFANVDEALKSGLSEETKNELRKQITDDNGKRRYTLKQRVKALRDDSGNIIVFLDNIKSVRDARRSVIHEMLHSALADVEKDPSLIKNKRLTKLIKKFTKDGQLRDVLDRMIGDEATRYEAGWLGRTDYSGASDDVLMEEALAKRSERGIGDASGMERAVSWMRGILSNAGIDLKMNSSDVAVFMQELRDIARSGDAPGVGEAAPVSGAYGSPEAEGRKVDSEEGWKYTSELAPEQAVDTPKKPKSRPKAAESEDDIPDAGETVRRPPMKKSVNKSKATKPKEEPKNETRADEEPAKPAPQARPVEEKDEVAEPTSEAPESPETGAKVEAAKPRDEAELAERERALISHLPDDVVLQMYNSLVAERSKQIKALAKEMSADKYKQALDALGELNARIARMEAIPRVKELLAQLPAPAKKTARKAAPKASVKKTEESAKPAEKPAEKPETSETAEQETEPDDGKTLEEMAEEQEQEKPEPAAEQEQKESEPTEEQAEEPVVPEQETTEEPAPDNIDAAEEEEVEPAPEPEKTEEEKLRDVIENPQEDESEDTKKLRETLEKITPIRNRLKEIKQRNDEIDQEDLVVTARLKQLDVEENDANARYSELLDIYENEDGDHTEAEQKAAKEEMDKIDARVEEIKKERDDINARRKAFADEITKLDTEENDLQNQFDMYTKDAKDLQAHFAASKGEIKGVFAGGVGETVAEEAGGPSAVLADVMDETQQEAEEDAEEEGKEENEPVKDNRSETLAKVRPVQRNAKRIENLYAAMPKRRAETDLAIEEHRRDEMVSTLRLADKRTLGDDGQYDRDLVQSMINGLQKELSALNGGTKRSADTDKKQDRLQELTLLRDAHDRLDQANAKIAAMRKALADIDSSTKDEIQKNGTDVKEGKQLNKYIASAISRVQKTLEKPLTDKERTEFTEHLNDIMEFGSRFAVAMAEYSRRGAEATQTTQEAVSRRNDVLSVMSSEAQKGLEAIESNSSTARTNLLMASAAFNTLTQMNKKPQTEEWKGKKVPKGTSLWGGDGGATLKWLVGEKVVGGTSRAENWEQNKALAEKIFRYNAEHKMGRTIRFRLESEEEQPKADNRFMGGKAKAATTLPVSTAPEIGYQNGKVRFLLVGNEAMNALADKGVPEAKKAVKGLDKAVHMLLTLPSRQNAIDATLGQAPDRGDLSREYLEIAKNTRKANVGGRLVDRLQDIKKETGWELGVDGKWRHELFDVEKILLNDKETGAKWDTGKILRVMRRWYPGLQISFVPFSRLRKAGVKLNTKKNGTGWLVPLGKNHYELAYEDKSSRDNQAGTIIHELQHLVQEQEGLARGSGSSVFAGMYKNTGFANTARKVLNDISWWKAREFGDGQVQLGPLRKKVESWIAQIEQSKKLSKDKNQAFAYSRLVDTLKMTVDEIDSQRRWGTFNKDRANDIWKDLSASLNILTGLDLPAGEEGDVQYTVTAGETEARNVERRMKMPEAERRGTLAMDTRSALGTEGHQPLEWDLRPEGRGTRMKPVRFRLASDAESNGDEPSAAMLRADVQDGPGSGVFDSSDIALESAVERNGESPAERERYEQEQAKAAKSISKNMLPGVDVEIVDREYNPEKDGGENTRRLFVAANPEAAKMAEKMEADGMDRKGIWSATGLFRGKDGKWRIEVPNLPNMWDAVVEQVAGEQKANELARKIAFGNAVANLDDFYKGNSTWKALVAKYPGLKSIKVGFAPASGMDGMRGFYAPGDNVIIIRDDLPDRTQHNVLMHELQHAIQRQAGFARGMGKEEAKDEAYSQTYDRVHDINQKIDSILGGEDGNRYSNWVEKHRSNSDEYYWKSLDEFSKNELSISEQKELSTLLSEAEREYNRDIDKLARDIYMRSAGEVEARNAARRRDDSWYDIPPWETEDVERDKQTVRLLHNDEGRVVGTFNRSTNKVTLYRGATVATLVHELGGHATLRFAEQEAERGNRQLLDRINRAIDEAPQALKDDVRSRYPDVDEAVLRDEIWAALREHNSPAMEKAIKTLQGRAWYNRAWAAFRDAWKGLLARMGFNRADLSQIDKMSNDEFLDYLDRTMAEGKTIGRLEVTGEGTRNAFAGGEATGGVSGVRFLLAPPSPSGSGAVDMNTEESRVDSIRRKYQDFLLPLRRLQHRLGIKDFSDEDVYHAYDRAFGYKENDVLRLDHDHVKPIMKFMKDNDISMEEATEFLNMAFAKERNQMIRDRDPSQDAGSGITDDEADDYFRDLKTRHPERYKTLNAFGKKVWRMNHQTLDRLVDSGIMSGEQANYYKTYSPHYVPLVTVGQVFDDNSDYMSGLSGGQLTEHALGRKSKAEDPLLVSVSQAQRAIVLARNNEVLRGLADLVRNHPNGVGIVRGTLPKQERYDRKKNRIVNRGNKRVSPDADIKFFENGKEMWIRLNGSLGEQVGRAISGKSIERSGVDALSRTARAVSRTFAAMRTTFSPEFTAGNLARDNAQAVFLLGGWYGVKAVKDFEAAMPMAMTNAVRILHGKQAVGDDAKYAQEWFDNGGMIGGKVTEAISTLDTRMRAMVDRFDNSPMAYLKRKASIPLRYIELFNQPFEMSTRMAAYIAMRKNGVDENEAIAKSRDITANFNRKGENTGFINSYWLFSNAIVQGMAPTIPVFANALKAKGRTAESNRALGTLVAATTLGLILSALNNAGGGDDDDEKDGDASYDHETEFNKQNNLIIDLDKFGAKGLKAQFPLTGQVRIPIYLGEVIGDAIFGKKGTPAERAMDAAGKFAVHVADEALDVTGAQVGAMAGLEGGKEHGQLNVLSIFSAMAPTAVRPLIEMATGRTWSGQDMTAKKFNDEQPDSDTSFNTTGKGWKALAKALNKMSGGSDNRSGWLDFAPETLRYAVSYLAGGIGSTGGRVVASIGGDDYGEHSNPQNLPFVNRFLRRQQDSTSDYYDRYSEWARLVYEVEHTDWTSDDPDTKNRAKELVRISPLLANESALKELKNTSRIISALRKVETSDEESDETKKKAKTIRLRMQKAYLDFTEDGGPAKRDYSQFYEDYGTLLMLSKPQRGGR